MLHTHTRMLVFFIPLFCYAELVSSANNALSTKEGLGTTTLQDQQSNFIINLPHVTTNEVLQQITDTQSTLSKRRIALSKAERKSSFNAKDGAISLIMPGGFLYAAVIKLRHIDIKKQLKKVTEQLNDLNQDLLAFRSTSVNNTLIATATVH
ncbi:hypothetical protein ACFL3U_01260 [Pseudomonadota bacterium]